MPEVVPSESKNWYSEAERTEGPFHFAKFHANPWIFWGLQPPKTKNCQNFQLFCSPEANPLPDVGEIHRMYVGNQSIEVVNIWCDSVGKLRIYRQKLW